MESKGCFIEGKWMESSQKLTVTSPWSGEVVGEVALAGAGEWEMNNLLNILAYFKKLFLV